MKYITHVLPTLLLALLAACGGPPTAEEAPAPTAAPVEATEAPAVEPVESATEPTAPEEASEDAIVLLTDDASLVVLEETDDTRVIRHLFGKIEVPSDPQRIVVLSDQNLFAPILELGEGDRVVGSAGGRAEDGTPIYRRTEGYDTSNVVLVGSTNEPNLELITKLNPDLIIERQSTGNAEATQEEYDLLSQIAPTIVIDQSGERASTWEPFFDIALLVNAQDEMISLKASYDKRVADLRDRLSDPSEIHITLIQVSDGVFIVSGVRSSSDYTVATDLGLSLTPVWQERIEVGIFDRYSFESIELIDADVLYVWDFDGDSAALTETPTYAALEVVQKGQAHVVDGFATAGRTIRSLNAWLDVFEETLLVDSLDTSWEPTE